MIVLPIQSNMRLTGINESLTSVLPGYVPVRALEQAKEKLEFEIELFKIRKPKLTENQVKYMLEQFQREVDDDLELYDQKIIECFVNSVYLYDNRLIITYNLTNEKSKLEQSDLDLINELNKGPKDELGCSFLDPKSGDEGNRTRHLSFCILP